MKIALLTSKDKISDNENEKPLEEALKEKDINFEWVIWSDEVDWNSYDIVLVRTAWDYQAHLEQFLSVLRTIEKSKAKLLNHLKIIQWNIDKKYLFELEERGIDIVPTLKVVDVEENFFTKLGEKVVFKPTVSASAHNTFKVSENKFSLIKKEITEVMRIKDMIVQPFLPAIQEEGEYSLQFFGGKLSHAVLKTPKEGDFRSQPEYGSFVRKVIPPKEVLEQADKVIGIIGNNLSYARVDLVEYEGKYRLMEVELIEPCLYFTYDELSAKKLVDVIIEHS